MSPWVVGRIHADAILTASICPGHLTGCGFVHINHLTESGSSPVFLETNAVLPISGGFLTEHGIAAASPGVVRGLSSANLSANLLNDFFAAYTDTASSFILDDILLSGPVLGEIIPVSFNVSISGSYGARVSGEPSAASVNASVNAALGSSILAAVGGVGSLPQFDLGNLGASTRFPLIQTGIFSSFPDSLIAAGAGFATTPPVFLTVGERLTVLVALRTQAAANLIFTDGFSDTFVDFSHALGFPTDGPVFNLPDGYTANSSDGFIVNNRFSPGGPAPVPLSGTLLLLGSGLLGMAGYGRKKLRRNPSA